ncbi:MAG: hypothetical protein SFZ03_08455 [Candidatus Melainabacteria bacterium]|nr:hypothetical protein [Candidatus Melainabacteria bacterium]
MYKKLLPFVNRFVYLRQGYFNRYYEGKILEVSQETVTLQAYDDAGKEEAVWVINLSTVTEFMVGDRELDELNMKVCYAKSAGPEDEDEPEEATPEMEGSRYLKASPGKGIGGTDNSDVNNDHPPDPPMPV